MKLENSGLCQVTVPIADIRDRKCYSVNVGS